MARIITSQTWNEQMVSNDASLAKALLLQPEKITPVLTYLMGNEDSRFPLHYLSEGMRSTVEIEGDEYEYDIVGRLFKAVPLAAATTTVTTDLIKLFTAVSRAVLAATPRLMFATDFA